MVTFPQHQNIALMPGDLYFGCGEMQLNTLLGSCVAIVLWHPRLRIGGMCHYVLPSRQSESEAALDGRYANEAMEMFMQYARNHGTRPCEYRVAAYGGANMFSQMKQSCGDQKQAWEQGECMGCASVSCRNRNAAINLCEHYGFPLAYVDLGGTRHRQLTLDLGSGDINCNYGVNELHGLNGRDSA